MPLTPQQALQRSPAARLSDDERAEFERFKERIDGLLSTEWPGGPFSFQTEPCKPMVMAYLARAYINAGWTMVAQPMDGKLGKASDLLGMGAAVNWHVTLMPDWARDLTR